MGLEKGLSRELISTFLTFVESSNISEAAEKLNLSQPAVSAQLKRFAEASQFPIFSFQGKRKVLTHYGKELFNLLKEQEAQLVQKFGHLQARYQNAEEVSLKIGLRKELFSRVVRQVNFSGTLQLVPLTGLAALEALAERKVDMAITQRPSRQQNVVAKRLFAHGAKVAIPKKLFRNRRMNRALASSNDLWLEKPFLAYREDPPFAVEWLSEMNLSPSQLRINLICEDWTLLVEQMYRGKGFTILPSDIEVDESQIYCVRIPDTIIRPVSFYAYYYPELKDVEVFRNFIQELVI